MKFSIMEKQYAKFNISSSGKVVIILDAGESAGKYWDRIVEIGRDIGFRISAEIRKEYYVLGNSIPFPEGAFEFPAGIKRENEHRGSFISPVLEGIRGVTDRIVVVGNGVIYDLEDWAGEGFDDNFLFINVGDVPLCSFRMGESVGDREYVSYINEMRKKIKKVIIHGKSFMPFFWNNRAYRLTFRSGKAFLEAEFTEDFSVNLGYMGENTGAILFYEDGNEIPLQPASGDPPGEKWLSLTTDEADLFRKASLSSEFLCPHCDEMHDSNETRCPNVGILGKALYESLEGTDGMVIFRESGNKVFYLSYGAGACYAGDNRVAAGTGGNARFYEYDMERGEWREAGVVEPYYEITPGHRILWL